MAEVATIDEAPFRSDLSPTTRRRISSTVVRTLRTVKSVSEASDIAGAGSSRTNSLPPDLTADELASAPTLRSLRALRIEDLTAEEFDVFAGLLQL